MAAVIKSTKKRLAPSQAGPTPKKAHLAKHLKPPAVLPKKDKSRSRPITLPLQESTESESDLEDDDHIIEEADVESDAIAIDSNYPPAKDPNGIDSNHMSVLTRHLPVFDIQHLGNPTKHSVHSRSNDVLQNLTPLF